MAALPLAACGAGSGEQLQSTPVPVSVPASTPVTTPATAIDFDTAEFRASSGPVFHDAIAAYEMGASGAGVTVAIVDSGIANADGEFDGRINPLSRDFAGNRSVTDIGGHGTAVAEVLAGARNGEHVQGMAWGADILALRTDKPNTCSAAGCEHSTSAMAQAIDFAWQNGARVINISLGGDISSGELQAAVGRATAAGTIVVIAAGNADTGERPSLSPDELAASLAEPRYSHGLVIIATSVGSDGQFSAFSDGAKGYEQVSLAALGDAVRTIDHKGTDLLYTGTSFSAPQIAGAAALLAEAFPNLSSAQIVQLLLGTARDAGAAGPDAHYGMGILDVAEAFAPQGTMTLAGTSLTLGTGAIGTFSAAMGDAHSAGLSTVALDSYRRAYRADLSAGMMRTGTQSRLTAALAGTGRQVNGAAGPVSMAFNIAPGRNGLARNGALTLGRADAAQVRLLSGTISARLARHSTLALGIRTGLDSLGQALDRQPRPSFLIASQGDGTSLPELHAQSSMALRQDLGRGFVLTSGIETGTGNGISDRLMTGNDAKSGRPLRYRAMLSALSIDKGALGLVAGLKLLDEEGSLLGARFTPLLGAQSARSAFASIDLRIAPAESLLLRASMQRGWTSAAAGGLLSEGGTLRTRSWSLDMARTGLFARGDLFGLRVSAPLRVTVSRFELDVPQSWDWRSKTATMGRAALNLVPQGSERDVEMSYGLGLSGGWLGANLFLRTDAGNVADMPDDYGAALRWSARF